MSQTAELQCCEPCTPSEQEQTTHQLVQPRVDILESADAWLLRAEMPGVDEGHADVSFERHVLTISGTADLTEPEGFQRQFGSFRPRRYERSFRLPETIDRSGMEATVQHGVLTVRIPKAEEAQPVKIAVKGA